MRCPLTQKAGLCVCAAFALLLPACQNSNNFSLFGYCTAPNYRSDIHTVRVKIFDNKTYRQGLEFEMTRAVIREIEQFTPYKVVRGDGPADTELTGTLLTFTKGTLNVNNVNETRDIETTLGVEFSWKDLRSGQFLSKPPRRPFEVPEAPVAPVAVAPITTPGIPGVVAPTVITTPNLPGTIAGTALNKILVTTTDHFIPELGQSLATAQRANIDKLAVKIRELMEPPW